jgi:hypothetical protein
MRILRECVPELPVVGELEPSATDDIKTGLNCICVAGKSNPAISILFIGNSEAGVTKRAITDNVETDLRSSHCMG